MPPTAFAIACAVLLPSVIALAAPAAAQPSASADPPRLEVTAGTWLPAPGLRLSADGDGIAGSEIDLRRELALPRETQWDLRLAVAPSPRHQFVAAYFPILTSQSVRLARDVRFVGAIYRAGQPLDATLTWHTWRGGYRYGILRRPRVSLGLNVDLWYSDLRLRLASPGADREGRSRLPIPGLGTSVRAAVTRRMRVTGEGSLFVIPDKPDRHFGGRYLNLSGTLAVQVTGPLAVQAGVRWIDLRHLGAANTGFGRLAGASVAVVIQR